MVINGIEYEERPRPSHKSMSTLAPYLAMMLLMGGNVRSSSNEPYNVIEEFDRIQKKQSKLSRSEREQVVREFNKRYKIKEP